MPKDEKPEAPLPKQAADRLPPEEWAKRKGHLLSQNVEPNAVIGTGPHFSWQHAAADAQHGWTWHAREFQSEPLLLTEADYMAALDAACAPVGQPGRHEAARSPHALKE